ncbi:rod shape-determining protein MreD [Spongiivirga citrea]|uniref:Rod shape-determining protein MreD n=1 Tax=Spongiivirga citrea TaxID=1481457 RepID=A0A6M0CX22_9FLAO|nr:rod shape-determining protein MreD [Spongiivirga citrea]NER18270.1 rod shape-determining protein MreD [Spongiivirga citrea]
MNNVVFKFIGLFILLVLTQVLVFNNIDFAGYIDPYLYIIFILLYPFKSNQTLFIFISFLLGLTIDMFLNSGGINAAACLLIAYVRPIVLKLSFGTSYEYQSIKIENTFFSERFKYFLFMITIHHLVLFALEIFNIAQILSILKKTLFSGIFTLILSLLVISLFSRKKES